MTSKTIIGVIVLILVVAGIAGVMYRTASNSVAATTFEECVAAGYPVMESYPRQCRTPEGALFVEEVTPPSDTATSTNKAFVGTGCARAGCSNVVCTEADKASDVFTTCEYRSEYACFTTARCEKQTNGLCGWTKTAELTACLETSASIDVKG